MTFQTPLELAHHYWEGLLKPGDIAIDATCGNGKDTLFLAPKATVYAIDIQKSAIEVSKKLIEKNLPPEVVQRVKFVQGSHSSFPEEIKAGTVKLVVYNLGYLPRGDKSITTCADSTLQSIQKAMELIGEDGLISITCYPGHPEGKIEEEEILRFVSGLHPWKWVCCHHRWPNRIDGPSLLLLRPHSTKV